MALSQKGATYDHRNQIADHSTRKALDDLASRIQAISVQGQFGLNGKIAPPSLPAQLSMTVSSGLFTAAISHVNPPAGTRYRLQWSTTPNFQNPIEEELATTSWQKSLPGQKLYFRVAAKFLASDPTPWVYFGSSASPTLLG